MALTKKTSPAYDYIPAKMGQKIPRLGETAEKCDPIAWIKLFTPDSSWTWYVIEYDPQDGVCYGLVHGVETEYGSFALDEISELRGKLGLPVERDLYFSPRLVSQCQRP